MCFCVSVRYVVCVCVLVCNMFYAFPFLCEICHMCLCVKYAICVSVSACDALYVFACCVSCALGVLCIVCVVPHAWNVVRHSVSHIVMCRVTLCGYI